MVKNHIPHIPDIPDIPHIPDIPDIPHIPDIPDIPHIPELFDLGIFHLVVSTFRRLKPVFFWVGFLAQHGPEPPSPILLKLVLIFPCFDVISTLRNN